MSLPGLCSVCGTKHTKECILITNKMNPVNDVVRNLLETPFSRWKDEDKRDVLQNGRPTGKLSIRAKKEVKNTGKCYNINFKSVWFDEFLWLCSSTVLEKLFCWPCLLFSNKGSVWNKEGFADLLNITRALHKHADSAEHLKCELMLKNYKKNQITNTLYDALKENAKLSKMEFNANVGLNRLFLQVVIDAVLYLSKQELAFRGPDKSIDSIHRENFNELLSLLLNRSPLEVRNQYEKIKNAFTEDSKLIQNELIEVISKYINDYVTTEIHESNFFSIQVDDTTDITQTLQYSVIVRFVNLDGILVERFLGFHDVSPDRTSEILYNLLHTILHRFHYKHKLVGQCYDGASVMPGHLNRVQKKLKDNAPQALFVHCLAHRLNLVLQQSFRNISSCRVFFASISGIPSFFYDSANRSYALNAATIIDTQWSSNSSLLNVIIEDWNRLKEVFEFVVTCEQSDMKSVQLAKGFLYDMNCFEFTFLAVVFNDIFCSTNILCDSLQKKSLDMTYCISQIKETCEILRGKRTDEFFNTLFVKTTELTEFNTKTIVKREDTDFEDNDKDQISQYRMQFFEILDHILTELDVRFQDYEKMKFVCLVDTTRFEHYKSYFPTEALQNLQSYYPDIFTKIQRLRNELSLIYADENYRNKTTLEIFQELHENKDIFTDAYKLFSIVLTIPSTNVKVEGNVSCLKRIKTCARNTVSQERLLSLANISIQKELLVDIMKKQPFYEDITDKFASLGRGRINLTYRK